MKAVRMNLVLTVALLLSAPFAYGGPFDWIFTSRPVTAPDQAPAQKPSYTWGGKPWDKTPFQPRGEKDCSPVAVDPVPFGKTRFQAKMGWCYAYATADLLSYCMKSEPISAADMSMNYARKEWTTNNPEDFLQLLNQGGVPWEAADVIRKKGGACFEKYMTSDAESFHDLNKLDGLTLYDQYNHGTNELIQKFMVLRNEFDTKGKLACADPCGSNNGCFSKLGVAKPSLFGDRAFLSILAQTTAQTYFDTIDQRLCDQHRVAIDHCLPLTALGAPVATKDAQGNEVTRAGHVLFSDMDQQLALGNPIEIAVNSHFLNSEDGRDTGGGGHAMILIGRKYRSATTGVPAGCYYQIRNSWGPSCTGYSQWVQDCDPKTGYIWVSEETLAKNLESITYAAKH